MTGIRRGNVLLIAFFMLIILSSIFFEVINANLFAIIVIIMAFLQGSLYIELEDLYRKLDEISEMLERRGGK